MPSGMHHYRIGRTSIIIFLSLAINATVARGSVEVKGMVVATKTIIIAGVAQIRNKHDRPKPWRAKH